MTELPKRRRTRLPAYDYSSPTAYFVTICTHEKRCILSDIVVGDGVLDVPRTCLSTYGEIVNEVLLEIARTYSWLSLDRYVIMPNHIHLLLRIEADGPSGTPAPTNNADGTVRPSSPANAALPKLVSTLKRFSNKRCGTQLWQRSYHEHVIRGEDDWREIRQYIENNPAKWLEDCYHTHGAFPAAHENA